MKEYIVPIEDSEKDFDEMFVGYIRNCSAEVVRCKDCKFFKGDGLECHWGMFAYEDDYCSNGERKEDKK